MKKYKQNTIATKYSEDQLIFMISNHDENGFHYLYENYSAALYGVIIHIVPSKEGAEEVIQDTFVKIWNSIVQYDKSKGRLYTWMINIARNTALDYIKSKAHQNELKNQSLPDFVYNDTTLSVSDQQDFIGFNKILDNLEEDKKVLIDLAYYKGYSQSEIAQKLEIPLGTVKTKMRNALMKLKDLLKDYR